MRRLPTLTSGGGPVWPIRESDALIVTRPRSRPGGVCLDDLLLSPLWRRTRALRGPFILFLGRAAAPPPSTATLFRLNSMRVSSTARRSLAIFVVSSAAIARAIAATPRFPHAQLVRAAALSASANLGCCAADSYDDDCNYSGRTDHSTLISGHRIASTGRFVILDGEQVQQYPLLGVLPVLYPLSTQAIALAITLVALTSTFWLVCSPRRRVEKNTALKHRDWLGLLPDPVARLGFYLHFEITAYASVLLEEVMTLVSAPVGLGRDLASRIAGHAPFAHRSEADDVPGRARFSNGTIAVGPRRRRNQLASTALPSASNRGASTSRSQLRSSGDAIYPGLYNTGNSCFLNSTLQSLSSVSSIRVFLEHIISQAETWDVPTPVADALYDVIVQLNTPAARRSAFVPRQLTDALSALPQTRVSSFFYAHQQQDAHELLVLVTGALDEEVKLIQGEREDALRAQNVGLCAAIAPSLPRNTLQSEWAHANPFRALMAQRTACLDCGYVEAVRHYPADELSLTVPSRAGSATTIEACLSNWSKIELVDWVCFHCSLVRTLERLRAEALYLANTGGALEGNNGHSGGAATSASAKKKSGAKRRKLRETKAKEEVISAILASRSSEDEVESTGVLAQHEIKLDRTFSRGATKQVMLARTPRTLVLHLNRSTYSSSNFGASKNNAAILFDEELDISPVVTGGDLSVMGDKPISRGATPMREEPNLTWQTQQQGAHKMHANGHHPYLNGSNATKSRPKRISMKTCFRLCAIVVHYGGHSSGHYVAFRRRKSSCAQHSDENQDVDDTRYTGLDGSPAYLKPPDEWYRISDDSVSRCSLRDVLVQNPFLLFYERIGDDNEGTGAEEQDHRALNGRGGSSSLPSATASSSLADTARQTLANGPQNGSHSSNGLASSTNPHCLPHGFEHMGRTRVERERALYNPRIVQRWSAMPPSLTLETSGDEGECRVDAAQRQPTSSDSDADAEATAVANTAPGASKQNGANSTHNGWEDHASDVTSNPATVVNGASTPATGDNSGG